MTPAEPPIPAALLRGLVPRTLERLVRAFSPERIILFGSYAKDTTTSASDIDLLVIAHLPGERGLHRRRARALSSDCFPAVDVVLATPEEIDEAPTAASPFLASILETGITLYTQARRPALKLRPVGHGTAASGGPDPAGLKPPTIGP
jgi:predicted nucleotidyltransferase